MRQTLQHGGVVGVTQGCPFGERGALLLRGCCRNEVCVSRDQPCACNVDTSGNCGPKGTVWVEPSCSSTNNNAMSYLSDKSIMGSTPGVTTNSRQLLQLYWRIPMRLQSRFFVQLLQTMYGGLLTSGAPRGVHNS